MEEVFISLTFLPEIPHPRDVDQNLQKFIGDKRDGKYVISLEYDGTIPYGQYVETVDMIYKVVYSFRKDLAMEKYGAPTIKLGDELQREIAQGLSHGPLRKHEVKTGFLCCNKFGGCSLWSEHPL